MTLDRLKKQLQKGGIVIHAGNLNNCVNTGVRVITKQEAAKILELLQAKSATNNETITINWKDVKRKMTLDRLYAKLYQLRGAYYRGGTRSIGDTKRMVRAMKKTKREIDRRTRRVPMYYKQ